jgi:hypothetical protein
VVIRVSLGGFGVMVSGLRMMGVGEMSMVAGFFMIAILMMLRGFMMMLGRLLMVFRRVRVMFGRLLRVLHNASHGYCGASIGCAGVLG